MAAVTIILPSYNEALAVGDTVRAIQAAFDASEHEYEILVIDDGSSDTTAAEAEQAGATVVRHATNIGYGNAILTGMYKSQYPLFAIADADGTYPVEELPAMVEDLAARNLDMLVGARQGKQYDGTNRIYVSRTVFRWLSEFTVGRKIPDVNSGLRVMRKSAFLPYAPVMCGGFSFTTTITLIAMLTHHFVDYRPVAYHKRIGKSKVHYFRDTLRAAQIMVFTVLLFNPIKMYLVLIGAALAVVAPTIVAALAVPAWQVPILIGVLLALASLLLFAVGLLAEQNTRMAALQGRIKARRDPLE